VAFTSGLIIFPACFAYGINPGAGPALIFQTLPTVFNNMPLGRLWGTLFFVFMSFAALSTVLAVFENIIACVMDLTGWKRIKTCIAVGIGMLLLSFPCVFGYNIWSGFTPFGEGTAILDLEDFVVSNLLLPLGALIFTLFCVTRYGWGWKSFMAEANTGKGLKVRSWMRWVFTIAIPIIILVIFIMGLVTFDFSR
jgi:NSS family neurotransmitter:Na+ symporter